jgi:hypothetical protein
MGLVLDILNNEVRKKIAVNDKVLKEARKRRDLVAEAAMEIEGALRWFRSGSVAHGWVNRPVTDADSGVVLTVASTRRWDLTAKARGRRTSSTSCAIWSSGRCARSTQTPR